MRALVVVLVILSALLGYAWQGERAAHARTKANAAEKMAWLDAQARKADADNRKTEKELSDATIQHAARVDGLLAEIRRAVVRSAGDSDRLRRESATFSTRSGAGCDASAAASDIEAGPSPAMVLADLFGRADARATELAQAADEARLRGLACEADYDRAQQLKD